MANTQQFGSKDNNTYTGTTLASWSRVYKIAVIASLATLVLLLVLTARTRHASNPATMAASGPAPALTPSIITTVTPSSTTPQTATPASAAKKVRKHRPANVTYSDLNSGVSFLYPRVYVLTSGDTAVPGMTGVDPLPMNFVEKGGMAVATVEMPKGSYPGTDFTTAFFHVNVNHSLTEQQCSQFAVTDTGNTKGEAAEKAEPEKVAVGNAQLNKTSDFDSTLEKQAEAEYYHRYENGACYEFVLGLGTQGYGTIEGIEPVSRDKVFGKLEEILASVKIKPAATEQAAPAETPKTVSAGEEASK